MYDPAQIATLARLISEQIILPDDDANAYEGVARKLYSHGVRVVEELELIRHAVESDSVKRYLATAVRLRSGYSITPGNTLDDLAKAIFNAISNAA
jgi:hypothetical protein